MDQQADKTSLFHPVQKFNNFPAPDFKSVYANNAGALASFFDMSVTFGEVASMDGDTLNVEQKVRVVMAMAHAKVLAFLLLQQIAAYETSFGEVKVPIEAMPPQVAEIMAKAFPR